MQDELDALLVRGRGGRLRLASPGVGLFTCALPRGRLVVTGQPAGVLITAGRARLVRVPAGVRGEVASELPERVHRPVGYGQTLYELEPLSVEPEADPQPAERETGGGGRTLPAPQTGRFWRRPAPEAPPLAREGDELVPGSPLGLIEVMKTFAQITYEPRGGLPERARVAQFLVGDGEEVRQGQPLVELEEG